MNTKFKPGDLCNWVNQPERLTYIGPARYSGDPRTWHMFALVEKPGVIWCEVLNEDLEHIEHTEQTP